MSKYGFYFSTNLVFTQRIRLYRSVASRLDDVDDDDDDDDDGWMAGVLLLLQLMWMVIRSLKSC